VVNELRGEKIDIVPFSDDEIEFVAKALQPARVREVRIHHDLGTAEVIVPDFQLSLAIGKEGQNARLAHRLTGLRIDIRSETEDAQGDYRGMEEGADYAAGEWVVDAESGQQMWQPADGSAPISLEEWNKMNAEAEEVGDGDTASADGDTASADDDSAEAPVDADAGADAESGDAGEAESEPVADNGDGAAEATDADADDESADESADDEAGDPDTTN
jgi:N utilization substance protein A